MKDLRILNDLLHHIYRYMCSGRDLFDGQFLVVKSQDKRLHGLTNFNQMAVWIIKTDGHLSPWFFMDLMHKFNPFGFYLFKSSPEIIGFEIKLAIIDPLVTN